MGTDSTQDVSDLETRVKAMRRLGVTKWGDIELGPELYIASPDEDAIQRSMTPEQKERERTRTRYAASGGPRPAVART